MRIRELLTEIDEDDSEPDVTAKPPLDSGLNGQTSSPPAAAPGSPPPSGSMTAQSTIPAGNPPPAQTGDVGTEGLPDTPPVDDDVDPDDSKPSEDEEAAKKLDPRTLSAVKDSDYVTKFDHTDDPSGAPENLLSMDDDQLKAELAKAVKQKRTIELVTDAGLYDDEKYKRVLAKIDFIKKIASTR